MNVKEIIIQHMDNDGYEAMKDIVREYLEDHGFDGLCREDCGCFLCDLFPCATAESGAGQCQPGHKRMGEDGDWGIYADQPLPPDERDHPSGRLPWEERVLMLSIHPDAASRHDVARLAAELMEANKQNDTADESLREANDEIVTRGVRIRELEEQVRQTPQR